MLRVNDVRFSKVYKQVYLYNKQELKRYDVHRGSYGIRFEEGGYMGKREVDAVRKVVRKLTKKKGEYWGYLNVIKGLTKKAVGVRMGKGKGTVSRWVYEVSRGRLFIEFRGVSKKRVGVLFVRIKERLSLKVKAIKYRV